MKKLKIVSFLMICITFTNMACAISHTEVDKQILEERINIVHPKDLVCHKEFIDYYNSLEEKHKSAFKKLKTYCDAEEKVSLIAWPVIIFFPAILSILITRTTGISPTITDWYYPLTSFMLFMIYSFTAEKIACIISGVDCNKSDIRSLMKDVATLMAIKNIDQKKLNQLISKYKNWLEDEIQFVE